jgi:hypothetical protein
MPNWCTNYIEFCACENVIAALLKKARGPVSPFDDDNNAGFSLLPFVEHLLPDTYSETWYEDNINILGCKRFPYIEENQLHISEGMLSMSFLTPWAPSDNATRHIAKWMSEQGFEYSINHAYDEAGCSYCGVLTIDSEIGETEEIGSYTSLCSEEILAMDEEELAQVSKDFDMSQEELLRHAKMDDFVVICPPFYRHYAY